MSAIGLARRALAAGLALTRRLALAAGLAAAVVGVMAASAPPAGAAYFTRIVDAANPLVNDLKETGGASWADLNGDGLPEVFVSHGNLTNQVDALYVNLGAFNFARVVTGPMATDGGSSIGSTWGDYDNDGKLDLFVTNRNFFGNFLYHATGDTTFERIVAGPVATDVKNSNSSSWVDVDRDGDLDLFVVNFLGADDAYRNEGAPGWAFTAVDTGAVLSGGEFSIPGAWCDYDDDGDADLFVGNAGSENDYLYTQVAPWTFVRTTMSDARATLGASWGDVDNDGDFDLFAASFVNSISILYRNAGPPTYALSPVAGTPFDALPGNNIGSAWGDFDNDADLDLFLARDGQDNLLFVNGGPPSYALARVDTFGVSTDGGQSFGSSWVDVDADGDLDLFVANRTNQNDFLYRNDGAAGHWLKFRLEGTVSNRAAIGARVRVLATVGGVPRWQVRDVEAQSGYNSQTLELHFGLGDAAVADSVVVRWPSGIVQHRSGVEADSAYVLVESADPVGVEPGIGTSGGPSVRLRLAHAGANPADGSGWWLAYTLPRSGEATLRVVDLRGRLVFSRVLKDAPAGPGSLGVVGETSMAPGMYFATLSQGGSEASLKLIRLRR